MRKYIEELIDDARLLQVSMHHSYLVYRKLKLNENAIIKEKLYLDYSTDINHNIRDVFYSNIDKSELIKIFDYKEGFNYKIIKIEYNEYDLIFMCSPLAIILVNFFHKKTSYPYDETICFFEVSSDLKNSCIYDFEYDRHKFTAINTHEPFIDFCNDCKADLNLDENTYFWNDFYSYINSCPRRGRYRYFQIGSLVIVYKYEKIINKSWGDIVMNALSLPTENTGH